MSGPDQDWTALHQALVDRLVGEGTIRAAEVEAAFRAVPRHFFLPGVELARVYRDEAIPTRYQDGIPISSSSQPSAMAIMLEQLGVRPGDRVLEIGAGTGYNAALLAQLAGPEGSVATIDIDQEIVDEARDHLAAAGVDRVAVVRADGGLGWPSGAPYDRIELTVGAWDVAPAWVEQLAPGGRLLLPLWLRGTQLTAAFELAADVTGQRHLASVSISGCAFMRLRGAFAGPEAFIPLDPAAELTLSVDDRDEIDPAAVAALLDGPFEEVATEVVDDHGLGLWLALREDGYGVLAADRGAADISLAQRFVMRGEGYCATRAILADDALAVLLRASEDRADSPMTLRVYAANARAGRILAERCLHQIAAWDAADRSGWEAIKLRVYPLAGPDPDPAPAAIIPKRWSRIAVDWT